MVGVPRAFDFRAHFGEQRGKVGNLRLERAIFEDGFAFGEDRGGENVFGSGDGDFREAEVRAAEALGAGFHVTVVDGNLRAQLFERLDVQVDGARADGAAAGQGNARVAEARDERAESQHGGAHGFHQFVGRLGVRNGFGLNG